MPTDTLYPSGSFSTSPADNVASFITNFAGGQYSDIKMMILDHQVVVSGAAGDCGFSTPKTERTLDSSVWWGKSTDLTGEGFVESHEGPCEAWCDDVMVMQNTNCATAYNTAGKAAEVPIDNSKCSGASRFTFYWIAMHTNEWQVYNKCLCNLTMGLYNSHHCTGVNHGNTGVYHRDSSVHHGDSSLNDGHADHEVSNHHPHHKNTTIDGDHYGSIERIEDSSSVEQ